MDALELADEVCARARAEPRLLGPWQLVGLELTVGLELGLRRPDGATQRLLLHRPGGPSRLRFGDFDATLVAPGSSPSDDALLRTLLSPWASQRIAWPSWSPDRVPLVVTGGIPRAGSQWCTRIVRTLLGCAGADPRARAGPPAEAVVEDAFDDIEQAVREQRDAPRQLRMEKAPYWPGSPDPDAPVRHFFARRDALDVLWSQLRQLEASERMPRAVAFRTLLEVSVPKLTRAMARAPAGPTTRVVEYEALSTAPEREVAAMARFLGLTLPERWIERVVGQHAFESESGHERGADRAGAYHRSGTIGEGRRGFDEAERAQLARLLSA